MPLNELVVKIRAAHPGAYDDMDDATLTKSVLAKYPQYSDLAAPKIKAPIPDALTNTAPVDVSPEEYQAMSPEARSIWDKQVRDYRLGVQLPNEIAGAGKGALNTLYHVGELGTRVLDNKKYQQIKAAQKANPQLAEQNKGLITPDEDQKAGFLAEQGAEFLAPAGIVAKGAKAAKALPLAARIATRAGLEGLSAGSISALHGDEHPLATAAVGAAGGAASEALEPLAGFAGKHARTLYGKALAPTTQVNKNLTKKVVPELLDQGEWGGLKTLSEKARDMKSEVGPEIDAALQAKGTVPQPIRPIMDSLDEFKGQFVSGNGTPLNKAAVKAAEKLQSQLMDMAGNGLVGRNGYVTTKDLVAARRVWDESVARSGGYAGKTLAEGSMADAMREGASSIRAELARANPDMAVLNAKYSFWSNVQKISDATLQRRTGQVGGILGDGVAELGGALVDGAKGGFKGFALNLARKAATSPTVRTGKAVAWNRIGQMISNGRFTEASKIARSLAVMGTSAAQDKDTDEGGQ